MSRIDLHIFVEGREVDSFFYANIASAAFDTGQLRTRITRADQLPGSAGAGGKSLLLHHFDYLRRASALKTGPVGSRYSTIFCLDKDIDNLHHTLRRSPHVCYTDGYSVENYLFRHGNLARSTAAALSIAPSELPARLGTIRSWLASAQMRWLEWAALCVTVSVRKWRGCGATFSAASAINMPRESAADVALLQQKLLDISTGSAEPFGEVEAAFRRRVRQMRRMGDRLGLDGIEGVFPGKWYPMILEADCRASAPQLPASRFRSFVPKVVAGLQTTIDCSQPWALRLRVAMVSAAALA